ncbi:hypothetical protein MUP00_05015 [Candidatus Bathyarchaeota archaeon]|nr:hypothetical protein [Candidatus Bathyarchaeota archaeon]
MGKLPSDEHDRFAVEYGTGILLQPGFQSLLGVLFSEVFFLVLYELTSFGHPVQPHKNTTTIVREMTLHKPSCVTGRFPR